MRTTKKRKSAQEQRKEGGGLNGCSSKCNDSQKKHRRIGAGTVVIYLVLIFWAVLTIFPFVWVVLNSFKPSAEVLRSSFSLPETFTWMNYQTAFERLNVLRAYRYSFVISGTVTVGVMVFASLMAFGLTRYHFKGKEPDPQPHCGKSDVSGIFHDHSGV
ncbi:MAG: carbohydrate ABC transporter permease [Roseburia hominis]